MKQKIDAGEVFAKLQIGAYMTDSEMNYLQMHLDTAYGLLSELNCPSYRLVERDLRQELERLESYQHARKESW